MDVDIDMYYGVRMDVDTDIYNGVDVDTDIYHGVWVGYGHRHVLQCMGWMWT